MRKEEGQGDQEYPQRERKQRQVSIRKLVFPKHTFPCQQLLGNSSYQATLLHHLTQVDVVLVTDAF